ncbi:MAG: hypothetical protein PVI23_13440, partial [Maricaulaceae bacterium]
MRKGRRIRRLRPRRERRSRAALQHAPGAGFSLVWEVRRMVAPDAAATPGEQRAWPKTALVALAAFALTLLIEAIFKFRIIAADGFLLDDFFFFERALHDRSFDSIVEFVPAFEGMEFDRASSLVVYRWLVVLTGDIAALRWLHVVAVSIACALFAAVLMRVTKDVVLSVFTSVLSFVTPFTFIISIFVNGTYNAYYFVFVFAALLVGAHLDFRSPDKRTVAHFGIMGALLLTAILVVNSGVFIPLIALGWVFLNSSAYQSRAPRRLFAAGAAVLVFAGALALSGFEHPYTRFPGRITYDIPTMFLNGLSILRNMVASYLDPMITTGRLTLEDNLVPAFAVMLSVVVVFGIGAYRNQPIRSVGEQTRRNVFFIGFLGA